MRKFTFIERTMLCLGIVLMVGGFWMAVFAKESGYSSPGTSVRSMRPSLIKLSKGEYRVYGVLGMVSGITLGLLACYPFRR